MQLLEHQLPAGAVHSMVTAVGIGLLGIK